MASMGISCCPLQGFSDPQVLRQLFGSICTGGACVASGKAPIIIMSLACFVVVASPFAVLVMTIRKLQSVSF